MLTAKVKVGSGSKCRLPRGLNYESGPMQGFNRSQFPSGASRPRSLTNHKYYVGSVEKNLKLSLSSQRCQLSIQLMSTNLEWNLVCGHASKTWRFFTTRGPVSAGMDSSIFWKYTSPHLTSTHRGFSSLSNGICKGLVVTVHP